MRAAIRALRAAGVGVGPAAAPLELRASAEATPPRVEPVTPLEGDRLAVRAVPGAPEPGIRAFLDGIQRSQVVAHVGAVPLVHGAVAAAVRLREARRLRTWGEARRREALVLPVAALDPALVATLAAAVPLVDTTAGEPAPPTGHPQDLAARALTAVQRMREAEELALLAAWVADGDGPLLVDGGISGSPEGARAESVVGVVKSHRTLYAAPAELPLVLGLHEGERTTAVALHSPRRNPVASWYLRLRDPGDRSPLFGLVRVEIAPTGDLTARADAVSRWVLAERAPVALPDPRWDVMVYGIRECEEYLTAILPR